MTDQQLYVLSQKTQKLGATLRTGLETLMNRHLYRYGVFVDSSERKFDCTYAQMTKRYLITDSDVPATIKMLEHIRDRCTDLINEIQNARFSR